MEIKINQPLLTILFLSIFFTLNFLFFFTPTFPDEITNFFIIGKNDFSFKQKLWLVPACLKDEIILGNFIIFLGEIITKFLNHINNILQLRQLTFLSSFILFVWFFSVSINLKTNYRILISLLILFWPIIFLNSFIFFRPEKFIIFFSIFLIAGILSENKKTKWIYTLFAIFFFLIAGYNHPKSLYFFPLLLVYLLTNQIDVKSRLNLISILLLSILITMYTFLFYKMHNQLWPCYNVIEIFNFNSKYATNPFDLFRNPIKFFYDLYDANDYEQTYRAVSQFLLRSHYDIGYFPNIVGTNLFSRTLILILNLSICLLVASVIIANILFIKHTLLDRGREFSRKKFFITIYLACTFITYLLGANKAPYDVALIITQLALVYPLIKNINNHATSK